MKSEPNGRKRSGFWNCRGFVDDRGSVRWLTCLKNAPGTPIFSKQCGLEPDGRIPKWGSGTQRENSFYNTISRGLRDRSVFPSLGRRSRVLFLSRYEHQW
jgi:hypothetical protein